MTGPSAWYADQYKHNTEYIYDLTKKDLAELDAAVSAVIKSGKDIQVRCIPSQLAFAQLHIMHNDVRQHWQSKRDSRLDCIQA